MKKLIFTIALAVIALSVNAKPKVVHVLSPDMKNSVNVFTDVGGFRLQISRNQVATEMSSSTISLVQASNIQKSGRCSECQ